MPFGRKENGFTLIEVFAAMVVFALGLLALSKLQVTAIASNSFADETSQAVTLAESTLEQLMSRAYAAPELQDTDQDGTDQDANSNGIDDDCEGTNPSGGSAFGLHDADAASADHTLTQQGLHQMFTVYWNIAVDQPNRNNKTIEVIVTYRDRKNRLHSVTLASVKTDAI